MNVPGDFSTEIKSCDLFVATGSATHENCIIMGKNSDRPVGEAQPFVYYPAADYPNGSVVQCTFITIPQAAHTFAVYGSKIYNIFGFEHGVNECGVSMGNIGMKGVELPEAQWGLLGMDILRLCLERCSSAKDAVDLAGQLLETYGSGGATRQRGMGFAATFLITDGNEGWYFESMNRHWAAKKITDNVFNASNLYAIRKDYDRISERAVEYAVEKGYISKNEPFDFAKAFYGAWDMVGPDSHARHGRGKELINNHLGSITEQTMMQILRDHYEGSFLEPEFNPMDSVTPTICCHAPYVGGSYTAASMITKSRVHVPDPFQLIYWGTIGAPCVSAYRPYFKINWLPEDLALADGLYDPKSQWWIFQELEKYVMLNHQELFPAVRHAFDALERAYIEHAAFLEEEYNGDNAPLKQLMADANRETFCKAQELLIEVKTKIKSLPIDRFVVDAFKYSCALSNIPYDSNLFRI